MRNFTKDSPKAKCSDEVNNILKKWKLNAGYKNHNSTDFNMHMPLHEILHQEHLPFLAFKRKPIPARFRPVINQLSGYAASKPNCAHEVYTELNTKKYLSELSPDEISLFEFLGGKV